MTLRLYQIDDTNRGEHSFLNEDDECYFLWEYAGGNVGWRGGPTNQRIANLQKKKTDGGYHYKAGAIRECSAAFSQALDPHWLASSVLVPVPPSKCKADPLYDDRMLQVCQGIRKPGAPAVRELIQQIMPIRLTPTATHASILPSK